ncbi:hypothetical protein GCM10007874_64510 [Labrys miyagiensis]|uniref:TIGR02301 family protein n=1 Tax=Labrys miyagiensis TaxID=346912 RepID=A0ABQ6CUF9_9HYPH|nr:TIGR02301 family protein [Labrys miyagiensis]GLS23430.1 hypothetical protein GCM10007874_64510 [Labrys miyagiensis]
MRRRLLPALAVAVFLAPLAATAQTAPPPAGPQRPAYEPQLLRLSELMGALHYLRALCGFADAPAWRDKMNELIDAQGLDQAGKERYAGAFNRGYRAYSETYRSCNQAAAKVIRDYLAESGAIIKDLDSRYGR